MIDLPEHPGPAAADVALIDFSALLTPSTGGPVQRVERMGRFRYSVTLPPMQQKLARQWLSALLRGRAGARMELHQAGFSPGSPGSPTVDGDGQSGRTLAITGATPNYVVRDGQFLNHVDSTGQHYVYMNVGETILNADGAGELTIEPMLRVEPDDGDTVKLSGVLIEGFITGEEQAWGLSVGGIVQLAFNLVEAR